MHTRDGPYGKSGPCERYSETTGGPRTDLILGSFSPSVSASHCACTLLRLLARRRHAKPDYAVGLRTSLRRQRPLPAERHSQTLVVPSNYTYRSAPPAPILMNSRCNSQPRPSFSLRQPSWTLPGPRLVARRACGRRHLEIASETRNSSSPLSDTSGGSSGGTRNTSAAIGAPDNSSYPGFRTITG